MRKDKMNRRKFLGRGMATGAAAGWAASQMTAAGYARVLGANDRVNLGLIGCGGRGRYIVRDMVKPANANTALVAICDVWKLRLDTYPAEAQKIFGAKPKAYGDYHEVLASRDVDAVIIASPAHQHCGQTIDAVGAGKHVYVEKPLAPIASDLPLLNKCHDAVKGSKLAVQNGSQGVSCPAARAVRKFIADGRLGKLFRVESTETSHQPYWVHYKGPKTEAETNWKAFLFNRKHRPFDAHQHASWMGYHDFSSGAIGGWMSHFINLVHFVTGSEAPVAATAFGGKFAPTNDARCDAPDQVTVVLEYAEGFHTHFTSHFGSDIDNEKTLFMFEKGMVRTKFGHNIGNPLYSSGGVNTTLKPKRLLDVDPPEPGKEHVANWLGCIRGGGEPSANIDFGYKQGLAVVMGDTAYRLGRKVVFDKSKREIRPQS